MNRLQRSVYQVNRNVHDFTREPFHGIRMGTGKKHRFSILLPLHG